MGTRYHVRCTRSHLAHTKPLPPLHLWHNYAAFPPGWEHPGLFAIEHHDSSEVRPEFAADKRFSDGRFTF